MAMLPHITVALWLSRLVPWWSRTEPCLDMLVGRLSWMHVLPGDDEHMKLAMPIVPCQVPVPHPPACRAALRGLPRPVTQQAGTMFPSPPAAFPQQLLPQPAEGAQPPTPGCAGSPSPGWQSSCYAADLSQRPDHGDRYYKTHLHQRTRGAAEDCLACWLPAPQSIFPD